MVYLYEGLSGFLIVLPYLVLHNFHLAVFYYCPPLCYLPFLYVFLSTFLQILFFFWLLFIMCTLSVIDIALDGPV